MSMRTLVWTLAAIAVVLILFPLLTMFGMMGGGWMMSGSMMGGSMMGDGMIGMSVFGALWLLLAIVVVIALIALLVRETTKT